MRTHYVCEHAAPGMSFALLPCLGCVCRIVHELALDAKVLEGSWSIGRHVAHDEIFDRAPAHDLRKTVGEREYRSANEAVEEGTCGVGRARTMVRMVLLLMPVPVAMVAIHRLFSKLRNNIGRC